MCIFVCITYPIRYRCSFVCVLLCSPAEWEERWVQSQHKSDYGEFAWTAGNFYGDAEKDKGMCVRLHVCMSVTLSQCLYLKCMEGL